MLFVKTHIILICNLSFLAIDNIAYSPHVIIEISTVKIAYQMIKLEIKTSKENINDMIE